jgi:lipopolysaccharide biosynthesis glycosyltransferase
MTKNAVLIIADEKQFAPAVFLADRLASLRGSRDVDIVLATNSPQELARARAFGGPYQLMDISSVHPELELLEVKYFTRASYFSLFVPALLQAEYDRLLYVDVDTYPESEKVFALFDIDLGPYSFAAIRDLTVPFYPNDFNGEELQETLQIPPEKCLGAKYLNSGVLLIDLKAYRHEGFEKAAVRLLKQKHVTARVVDQTIFNAILRTRWLELSPSFNMIPNAWASFVRQFSPPVIVHFVGAVKPWHRTFADNHPVRLELPAFLKDTPWATFIADINRPPQLVGGQLPPPPVPRWPFWTGEPLKALVRYLRETRFADAEQGITRLDYSALPAAG